MIYHSRKKQSDQIPDRLLNSLVIRWLGVLLCTVGLTAGCTVFNHESESQKNVLKKLVDRDNQSAASKGDDSEARASAVPPTPSSPDIKEKVRFAGGLMLGDTDNVAFQPDEFRQTVVTLIEEQQWRSLKRAILIYPDLTMTLITEANGQNISWGHVTIAARVLDLTWGLEGDDSWQKYVEQTSESAKKHRNFSRAEFLSLLSKDELKKALDLKLVKSLGKSSVDLAKADALRLEGIAYLMLEDHDKSIAKLEQAYRLVYSSHPYFASHIGLMLGEAHRHAGDADNWKASWQEAVEVQSQWFEQSGITDPTFWKRAAFLRPLETEWPTSTIERINVRLAHDHLDFSNQGNEAIVWALVGLQSLQRHESQNAILAYKKSESIVTHKSLRDELQFQQAIAMIDGGQPGPASAILIGLGSGENVLADRARAILASLKLQNGSLAQGMNLLQVAIKSSNQWPTSERLRAQADMGLALLMRDREQEGIDLLNQVHDQFLSENDFDQARQCLWNIAKYYEATDKSELYEATQLRMQELQNSL